MEKTKITKVQDVRLLRRGEAIDGTLHLTPHHLIFASRDGASERPKELWVTYPIIHTCFLRLSPYSQQRPSIRLRCRDFNFLCFQFLEDKLARDVYDNIKGWTCKLGKIERLYAFSYQPPKQEKEFKGWHVYDARREWERQGVGTTNKEWRISSFNSDYEFSPTYPALLPVPSTISDITLNYAGRYRSRVRLPILTYLHPLNKCSISRSAQPLVGVRQNRSIQDEKLVLAIFNTTRPMSSHIIRDSTFSSSNASTVSSEEIDHPAMPDAEATEDAIVPESTIGHEDHPKVYDENPQSGHEENPQVLDSGPKIYGAQQRNMIVDARPTINAYAMQAVGMGSENMEHYPFATKVFLGIDNIHVMRDSLQKVIDALKDFDVTDLKPNRELLAKSNWPKHIANMLDGTGIIARQVGLQHSHVLIHCSDGWDRTSQLSALSQLCLDPHFRTIDGFIALIEKDWLSFGHMFATRSGHLSSEKWFTIENERIGGEIERQGLRSSGSAAGVALENAFLSAKGFFNKENSKSRDSLIDSDEEDELRSATPARKNDPSATKKKEVKVKEVSPMFHQFLDAAYQLHYQYPTHFEFNERFLRRLLYHLYSCQYGTFLYNSEKERKEACAAEKTASVWDYFLSRKQDFLNPRYERDEGLILPRTKEVRWWNELFGRPSEDMN